VTNQYSQGDKPVLTVHLTAYTHTNEGYCPDKTIMFSSAKLLLSLRSETNKFFSFFLQTLI